MNHIQLSKEECHIGISRLSLYVVIVMDSQSQILKELEVMVAQQQMRVRHSCFCESCLWYLCVQ